MAIDTGQSLTFNANFPVPGVNQSSQPFRDNYQIIKRAIENLQSATAANASVLDLTSTLDPSTGAVKLNAAFKNNAFIVPSGAPVGSPSAGMIRMNNAQFEYYDGFNWVGVLSSGQSFTGQINLSRDPITNSEAVSLGYLNNRLALYAPANNALPASAMTGGIQQGVYLSYDPVRQKVDATVPNFYINLVGPVRGSGFVNKLSDVTIQTSTDFISGITVQDEGVSQGAVGSATYLNFIGNGISVTQSGQVAVVSVPEGLSNQDVRNEVGNFISGTTYDPLTQQPTETGVTVYYDSTNNSLQLGVREFNITLTGAVTGTARVKRLQDVTISTATDLIRGLSIFSTGQPLGPNQSVQSLNFSGDGLTVTQSGSVATINVPVLLTQEDVRNTIGTTVYGVQRDPSTNIKTETGITTNYDAANNVLELGVRDFAINLAGAVTGTATVSRLRDITINTSSNYIEGITLQSNGILLAPSRTIRSIDLQGVGFTTTVSGDTAVLNFQPAIDANQVRTILGDMMEGSQGGMDVVYDVPNQKLRLQIKPFVINLSGAVQGTGTVVFDNTSTGVVNILTTTSSIASGLEVKDEYGTQGSAVRSINFVGGGVTSSVSVDGEVATVYIPNSPGNEEFVLLSSGSQNAPNSRRLVAGSGIVLNDGGAGGDLTISSDGSALANIQYQDDNGLVAERPAVQIASTAEIISEVVDDPANNRVIVQIYSLADGWYRASNIDCGYIDDKYGNSLDMGNITGGIIEIQADLGDIVIVEDI